MKQNLGASAIAVLTLAVPGSAQTHDEVQKRPITLVGCVEKESDYRRSQNIGSGGFFGLGGRGDEFVLVNAFEITPGEAMPAEAHAACGTSASGEAYELEGQLEDALDQHVGRRVQISGTLNKAEIDVATGRPTGGSGIGSDLRLFEVDVASIGEPMPPVAQVPPATTETAQVYTPAPTATAEMEMTQQVTPTEPRPVGTAGMQAQALPRTATPLPLVGLLGLLSMAAGLGLRMAGRS